MKNRFIATVLLFLYAPSLHAQTANGEKLNIITGKTGTGQEADLKVNRYDGSALVGDVATGRAYYCQFTIRYSNIDESLVSLSHRCSAHKFAQGAPAPGSFTFYALPFSRIVGQSINGDYSYFSVEQTTRTVSFCGLATLTDNYYCSSEKIP